MCMRGCYAIEQTNAKLISNSKMNITVQHHSEEWYESRLAEEKFSSDTPLHHISLWNAKET